MPWAEVEHERAPTQATQDAICLGVQRRTAGNQVPWIKVALLGHNSSTR